MDRTSQARPVTPRWEFGPDIPTEDWLDDVSLDDVWDLQQAVESFVWTIEEQEFVAWEAVVSQEQGLPLTKEQEDQLNGMLNFGDPDDEQILYYNDTPRPSQPWHVILNKIVPHLLIEPFDTSDCLDDILVDGWSQIVAALREHGHGLSLPAGVASPEEVIPPELRHKLWLQVSFEWLDGLGQEPELTLRDEEDHYRIEEFIDQLRAHKDSVAYLDLTITSMLSRVIMPEEDVAILIEQLQKQLGVPSCDDRLENYL